MVEDNADPTLFPARVGDQLRQLREAAKLDLTDIATRTRIPLRHLEAIERSDYSALPSPTYAMGFVRSYARAIGADDATLSRELRVEMGREVPGQREATDYEVADPARVPSRLLAWTAALLALLVFGGYAIWQSGMLGGQDAPVSVAEAPPADQGPPVNVAAAASAAAPSAAGQVVLTATAPVWLRIRDADGKRLFEKEMAAGETYSVPADARGPVIQTGRADAIRVTIDGREVAPLGPAQRTVKAGISAAALAARPVAPVPAASVPASGPALSPPATTQ